MIACYLRAHALIYDIKNGPKTYNIKEGISQGSVLKPLLWNIMLKSATPAVTTFMGFASNDAVVPFAKYLEDIT